MSLTPAERTAFRKFSARLSQVEKGLKRATRTASLAYSSQEGGASEVYDDDGALVVVTGDMGDGTFGVAIGDGTTAPVPVATTQHVAEQVAAIPTPTRSDVAPTTETPTNGAQWYQTEPDGVVIGWWIADGTTWVPQTITGVMLAVDALDGKTITGATLRTAAGGKRVVLDSVNFIRLYSGLSNEGVEDYGYIDQSSDDGDEHPRLKIGSAKTEADLYRTTVDLESGPAQADAQFEVKSGFVGFICSTFFAAADSFEFFGGPLKATMGAGSVGTGAFRDSVDARANAAVDAAVEVGEFVGSTNGSAQVTITHGLGSAPSSLAFAGSETYGTDRHRFTYDNVTSTTFRVTVRNNTAGLVSSPTRFMWQAWR